MRLYRTTSGVWLELGGTYARLDDDWDSLVSRADLAAYARRSAARASRVPHLEGRILAPIGRQEVWAAGVTYHRSRVARADESRAAGGASFYDRVSEAERPELFFKAAPWRVRGPDDEVRIRRDARWSVPEPEIALCVNAARDIVGFTIGNDMSSRDIEGENPLYLPQAKIYDGSCALGPAMLVAEGPLPPETTIAMTIARRGDVVFDGATTFSRMRCDPRTLVEYLYRETSFPDGAVLLTGTGVVPPNEFTLERGDVIRIEVPAIGVLSNVVA